MAKIETVERVIPASPEAIFSLIADPSRHPDIDGSGSVREAPSDSKPMSLGSEFGMSMKLGIAYTTSNIVTEFEPNRRLAWQTRPRGPLGRMSGGRTWRYELEPVDGGTRVRETWDITTEAPMTRPLVRAAANTTRRNMEATLERIEKLVAG